MSVAAADRAPSSAFLIDAPEPAPGAAGSVDLGPDALRSAYVDFLLARLGTRQWLPEVPS